MERPATIPDQARAADGRASSVSPSIRTASWTTTAATVVASSTVRSSHARIIAGKRHKKRNAAKKGASDEG